MRATTKDPSENRARMKAARRISGELLTLAISQRNELRGLSDDD